MYTAWMIRQRPQLVHAAVLVDPIPFMLHEAHVPYNFLYRPPERLFDWVVHAFVASEIHIAHALHRTFDWCEQACAHARGCAGPRG